MGRPGLPAYIVAEIRDDGRPCLVTETWSREVFTDRDEALAELDDAHEAGFTGLCVYQLKPCRALAPVPPVEAQP